MEFIVQLKDKVRTGIGWRRYRNITMLAKAPCEACAVEVWRRTPEARAYAERLTALRNRHKGQRGFIIGNGPSLNKMDLTLLADEVTIGSNGLFLAFDRMGFVPTYYTIEDRLVAEDRCREAAAIKSTQRIYPHDLASLLGEAGAPLYVPFRRAFLGFPRFSTNIVNTVYWGGTVTVLNLQIAFYLGCNPVYIVGCDHNYMVKDDVQKRGTHFTSMSDDPNHFDANYFGKGYRWHDPNVDRMEEGYRGCRMVFEDHGRAVFNATVGGRLEVFDRVDFLDLF